MTTFAENSMPLNGMHLARLTVLHLSLYDLVVKRIRISGDAVMIEVDEPLPGATDTETKDGYTSALFYGCKVVWRASDNEQ